MHDYKWTQTAHKSTFLVIAGIVSGALFDGQASFSRDQRPPTATSSSTLGTTSGCIGSPVPPEALSR